MGASDEYGWMKDGGAADTERFPRCLATGRHRAQHIHVKTGDCADHGTRAWQKHTDMKRGVDGPPGQSLSPLRAERRRRRRRRWAAGVADGCMRSFRSSRRLTMGRGRPARRTTDVAGRDREAEEKRPRRAGRVVVTLPNRDMRSRHTLSPDLEVRCDSSHLS